jgi:hypothetical protein
MYNSSQFRFIQKIHQEKNIDDARVTQDEVIVKHGLKKWQHFNPFIAYYNRITFYAPKLNFYGVFWTFLEQ